jgi:hypothetical protein
VEDDRASNWILKLLRVFVTFLNVIGIIGCMIEFYSLKNFHRNQGEYIVPFYILTISILNTLLIWSPIRELSGYYSVKFRRMNLEEKNKIDKIMNPKD